MGATFQSALSFVGNGLSAWDTSSVTNMYELFEEAASFVGDLSTWQVSSVVNMAEMFQYASSFNGDISKWDVANVVDFDYAFSGAASFNRDLSQWNIEDASGLVGMVRHTLIDCASSGQQARL